jgi:hypothetical protein
VNISINYSNTIEHQDVIIGNEMKKDKDKDKDKENMKCEILLNNHKNSNEDFIERNNLNNEIQIEDPLNIEKAVNKVLQKIPQINEKFIKEKVNSVKFEENSDIEMINFKENTEAKFKRTEKEPNTDELKENNNKIDNDKHNDNRNKEKINNKNKYKYNNKNYYHYVCHYQFYYYFPSIHRY